MNEWTHLDGDRGRYVRRGEPKKRSAESTPGYTPTTSTSHLPRPRPKLYEAAVNGHKNQLVAIKTVEESDQDCLIREFHALSALSDVSYVPEIREFNYDRSLAFIALEYLGDDWVSLDKDIQKHKPFRERYAGEDGFQKLRNSIENALSKIHRKGVVHGDLKSNHIFIRRKNNKALLETQTNDEYELDYSDIKVIDFGASYLSGETSKWHGGSIGFSNPYHWNPNHRDGLQFAELMAIDWYSVNAILFHAYTGECFPVASPAYRLFIGKNALPDIDAYFKQLERNILLRFGGADVLVQIVHNLCNPKDLVKSEEPARINILINTPRFNFQLSAPLFIISILLLGQLLRSTNTIWETSLALITFTFSAILLGSISAQSNFNKNWKKNNNGFTWIVNLLVFAGIVVVSAINVTHVPKLLPIIVFFTVISTVIIVLSIPIFPNNLNPIAEGILILGTLGSVSIPESTLIIIPILVGISASSIYPEKSERRIFSYSYLVILVIISSLTLLAKNMVFGEIAPTLGLLGQIPFQLLRLLIWCFIAELVSSSFCEYKIVRQTNNKFRFNILLTIFLIAMNQLLPF